MSLCRSCDTLLHGSYYTCLLCSEEGHKCDLCGYCHKEGKFRHMHSSDNFVDMDTLLKLFRNLKDEEKTRDKRWMEELREIAIAYYEAGSPEAQEKAKEFFRSLDCNEDGRVDHSEFLAFMKELQKEGYPVTRNPRFFEELDREGNGNLGFWDVMTLYYVLKSGRPFCDSCQRFIPGIYFSCPECFTNRESSINICLACYRSGKYKHYHDGRTQFLDNYILLEARRDSAPSQAIIVSNQIKSHEPSQALSSSFALIPATNVHPNSTASATSNAIVVPRPKKKWQIALIAFELALGVGNLAASSCTIM